MSVETLPRPANVDLPPQQPEASGLDAPDVQPAAEFKPFHRMTEEEFAAHTRAKYGDPDTWTEVSTETPAGQPAEPISEQSAWSPDPEVARQYDVSQALEHGEFAEARIIAASTTGAEHRDLMAQIGRAEWRARLTQETPVVTQAKPTTQPIVPLAAQAPQIPKAPGDSDATAELYIPTALAEYEATQDAEVPAEVLDEGHDAMVALDKEQPEDDDLFGELMGSQWEPKRPKVQVEAGEKAARTSIDLATLAHAAWRRAQQLWKSAGSKMTSAAATGGEALKKGREASAKFLKELADTVLGPAAVEGAGRPTLSPGHIEAIRRTKVAILERFYYAQRRNDPDLITECLNTAHDLAFATRPYDRNSYAGYYKLLQGALQRYPGEYGNFMRRVAYFRHALAVGDTRSQNRIIEDALSASNVTHLRHEVTMYQSWGAHHKARLRAEAGKRIPVVNGQFSV